MSWMTEEMGQRILDELKRLGDILDRQQPGALPNPYERGVCFNCGEKHGSLPCPLLQPQARRT